MEEIEKAQLESIMFVILYITVGGLFGYYFTQDFPKYQMLGATCGMLAGIISGTAVFGLPINQIK